MKYEDAIIFSDFQYIYIYVCMYVTVGGLAAVLSFINKFPIGIGFKLNLNDNYDNCIQWQG